MSTPHKVRRRLVYGGSWYYAADSLRSAYYDYNNSAMRFFDTSFRVKLRRVL